MKTIIVAVLMLVASSTVFAASCHEHQVCTTHQQGYDAKGNPVFVTECHYVCD